MSWLIVRKLGDIGGREVGGGLLGGEMHDRRTVGVLGGGRRVWAVVGDHENSDGDEADQAVVPEHRVLRVASPIGIALGLADGDVLDHVGLPDDEIDDRGQDAAEEDHAGHGGAEAEPAFALGQRQPVAHVRSQRPSEDVGEPEREHRVRPRTANR